MNIFLRGGGFSNKGDEAMMLTVQTELARRLSGTCFFLRTTHTQLSEAYSCGFSASVGRGGALQRAFRFASTYATNRDVRRASRLNWAAAETIADARDIDCVLDFSGFNYSDEWGVGHAKHGLAWAEYCTMNNIPFVCLPQAWGPFRTPGLAAATRELCKHSTIVYARDEVSMSHLQDLLRPDGGAVRRAPDMAFAFSGESPRAGRECLKALGIDMEKSPLVGMAPNMRVYERCRGEGTGNEYVQMLIRVAKHCIHTWGISLILLPHEFSMRKVAKKDDRFLCGLVAVGVSDPERCFTPRAYISARLLKSIEGQIDFLIGSRYHSCVFALSSGIPAVALGWTHKYPELMELVGLHGDALIHTQFDGERVLAMLDRAWEKRVESAASIRERLPVLRAQVAGVFDEVAALLTKRL